MEVGRGRPGRHQRFGISRGAFAFRGNRRTEADVRANLVSNLLTNRALDPTSVEWACGDDAQARAPGGSIPDPTHVCEKAPFRLPGTLSRAFFGCEDCAMT